MHMIHKTGNLHASYSGKLLKSICNVFIVLKFQWKKLTKRPQKSGPNHTVHFSSVVHSCQTLCDPMDCSTPGFHVHHRLQCPSNSCPSRWWCHPTISSSVIPFSSCPQSFPSPGSFQMSQLFTSRGQSIGASNSYPSSRWCHPTISSSVVPFSSCPQSFP